MHIWLCCVIPTSPLQRANMRPLSHLGIYIKVNSLSIIRYLDSMTGDPFTIQLCGVSLR